MNPKIYLVGGACRDILLGFTPKDRDYVVVGTNHDWMISQGFTQVGLDFPVYLHPETGEEYALARREKKVGTGYNGFETETENVSLETDCKRRDLTINAMAMDEDGKLYDFFGGEHDLEQGVLRHVSDAFKEDPIRVLRLARFAARYNFKVAPETIELCKQIVDSGELNAIDINRFWKEISRVVREPYANRFIEVLEEVGASRKCNFLLDLFGISVADETIFYIDPIRFRQICNVCTLMNFSLDLTYALAFYPSVSAQERIVFPTMAKFLLKQLDTLKSIDNKNGSPTSSIVDFCLDSKILQKGNANTGEMIGLINALCMLNGISNRLYNDLLLAIRHLSVLQFVPDMSMTGPEIGKAKRQFYIDKLNKLR